MAFKPTSSNTSSLSYFPLFIFFTWYQSWYKGTRLILIHASTFQTIASNSNDHAQLPQPTVQANDQPVSQKLVGPNYLPWSVQFMVFLRSHDLADLVDGNASPPSTTFSDGTTKPAYTVWLKKDTCVLSWLLASIIEKPVSTVYGMKTSRQVWDALYTRFSSTSRSRIALLKRQL